MALGLVLKYGHLYIKTANIKYLTGLYDGIDMAEKKTVNVAPQAAVPGRRRRRPLPKPSTPEQITQAFKDFAGPDKKWGLREEVTCILEEVYPFPIRKNWTLTHALLKKFPKWWVLHWVDACDLPGIPDLYNVEAYMTNQGIIKIESTIKSPYDKLTPGEWDKLVESLGRIHDVLYLQYERDPPKPDPKAAQKARAEAINP